MLARVIADALDGEYDDGNYVFYSCRVIPGTGGNEISVTVSADEELDWEREYVVSIRSAG